MCVCVREREKSLFACGLCAAGGLVSGNIKKNVGVEPASQRFFVKETGSFYTHTHLNLLQNISKCTFNVERGRFDYITRIMYNPCASCSPLRRTQPWSNLGAVLSIKVCVLVVPCQFDIMIGVLGTTEWFFRPYIFHIFLLLLQTNRLQYVGFF